MSLITTPIVRGKITHKVVSARVTKEQAATFKRMGGAAWLRAQLDVVAQLAKKK